MKYHVLRMWMIFIYNTIYIIRSVDCGNPEGMGSEKFRTKFAY